MPYVVLVGFLRRTASRLNAPAVIGRASIGVGACLCLALAACDAGTPTPPPIDTTPPTIVGHQPAAGEDNVPVSAPITVEFSEVLDPDTVTDATVQLAGSGSVNLAKTLTLDENGQLTVTPLGALDLPQTLTLGLTAGIRDPAGNALQPESWSWTVPTWLRLGDDPVISYVASTFIYPSHLELDGADLPVVAGNREETPQALLRRWDGGAWVTIPPPNGAQGNAFVHDIALDPDDDLILAWSGWFDETFDPDLFVSRWDGEGWTLLGGGLTIGDVFPEEAALAITSTGAPVVAFSQKSTPGNSAGDLYVRRWTGVAWTALGDKLEVNDAAAVQAIDIALDPDDDPIVAWGERFFNASFVKAWDPTLNQWQALGGSLSAFDQAAALLVRDSAELVAALNQGDGSIRLFRYTSGGWVTLGPPLRRSEDRNAGRASLAENAQGQVVVGWSEFAVTESAVNVAVLIEGSWQFVSDEIVVPAPASASNVQLSPLAGATPAVVYTRAQQIEGESEYDVATIYRYLNE